MSDRVTDPYRLERFLAAQDRGGRYQQAVAELCAGQKGSHWMWFVFPQIAGLGHSETARLYAIGSLDEARGYLAHPVLGQRLRECARIVADTQGRSAERIFGPVDAMKLRSSMTLFATVAEGPGENVFRTVLTKYFDGVPDEATTARLLPPRPVGGGRGSAPAAQETRLATLGLMDAAALIPSSGRTLPMAVAAKGARIFDADGLDYIDASSGPLAVTLGHGHPRVLAALADQFNAVDYVHRTQFRNSAAERLATLVTERLGGGLGHVLFVSSGSEANEIAMKFAHMYWVAKGLPDKHRFVSSSLSYHGNTAGALSASGQPRYAASYRPLVHAGETITAPQVYRLPVPEGSTAAAECIARLRAEFSRLDLRRTAAVMVEGIGGAGSGVLVPPAGFLAELRRLCDAHDVLWISDEVMSGFGRTGTWFAFQRSGAVPDIVTFAKGAGGGSVPLGGAALSRKVWSQIGGVHPAMSAGHTFTNSPLACAAGIATIEALEEEHVLARVADRGAWLGSRLRDLAAEFPFIGDVRGAGYLWGVEFVADPATAEPPDPALDVTTRAVAAAAGSRLIVYPARYCMDGTRGDAILIGPPLTATDEELAELLTRLHTALTALRPLFSIG